MRKDEIKWAEGWDKTLPDTVQTENMSQEINTSESILGQYQWIVSRILDKGDQLWHRWDTLELAAGQN